MRATQSLRSARVRRRSLNPWAWWLWALGIAAAMGFVTNPVILALGVASLWLTVAARKTASPWAQAFGLYVGVAVFIVCFRVAMHILVGMKSGTIALVHLPTVELPSWAAGITILGTIYAESLMQAALDGLRLGTILIAVGAANSLANPRQLLRSLPAALGEVGTAIIIALALAPQLAESLQRVHRTRQLRGDSSRGIRGFGRVVLPVLQDTLDGALKLAASMDARGYGRRALVAPAQRRISTTVSLFGLVGLCIGLFLLLDATLPLLATLSIVLLSCALVVCALALDSRRITTTRFDSIPWGFSEWFVALTGLGTLGAALAMKSWDPASLSMSLYPLGPPVVPWLLVAALLLAAAASFVTPQPAPPAVRSRRRRADWLDVSGNTNLKETP